MMGSMKRIVTTTDLEDAISQSRAFIFVAVDWAIHSRQSEAAVRELLDANQVDGYRIDVTEQQGDVWIAFSEWLAKQGQDVSRIADCGCGPLLLSRSGRIVASVLYPAVQPDELLALAAA